MVAVPAPKPLTTPALSTVATLVLLLLQTPPDVVLASVVVLFKQTVFAPVIAGTFGVAFTVIILLVVFTQPVAASVTVYLIVVPPTKLPVTSPVFEIEAMNGVTLVHAPFAVAFARVIVLPTQTALAPIIDATVGKSNTVIVFETEAEQPLVEIV
jgi:hypothetical protein